MSKERFRVFNNKPIFNMNTFKRYNNSIPLLFIVFIMISSAMLVSKPVHAENEQLKALMLANNCMACHMIDKRKYGPQFNEVAAKYRGNKSAPTMLATKIKAGGSGVWGEDMMPPQAQVSDADAQTIAELILALKPKK
jgi:cytochrome c